MAERSSAQQHRTCPCHDRWWYATRLGWPAVLSIGSSVLHHYLG